MPDLLIVLVLSLSAFIHGALGFGMPLVATPLLVLLMDVRAAVLVTLIPVIASNLGSILGEDRWREALRQFWPIPVFTAVGSLSGTQVLLSVDPSPFRLLLALALIAYLLVEQFGKGPQARVWRLSAWGLALLGLIMGLMAGVVNIFSPVVVVFALHSGMNPALMVATFNLSFITSKSGQLAGFALGGGLNAGIVLQSVVALPAVLLSLWLGIRLRRRIDQDNYRRLLRYGLWVIAALLILDWLRK